MKATTERRIDIAFRITMAIVVVVATLAIAGLLLEYLRGVT